ncbi:sulfatase family protein [Stratiformator vulcanicus]|uniref:Arylsulfatase n=1 Tax=Stratiformator vulcanicus TaxID=2527980 RepID=A0A517R6Y6_9PLAN|nr:sulfatase [Stratiformator vulcanicus]QDT39640.1 Arylsulfatase [Stratiformator vulcanicus]
MRVLLSFAVLCGIAVFADAEDQSRPNFLFLLSDDHRGDVLGCAGHPIIKTPNIDRLAAEGVRFENAYVTTSICAASRASILTGLVERTHQFTFGTPPLHWSYCAISYPRLLHGAGYYTGFVGKIGIHYDASMQSKMFDFYRPMGRNPYWKVRPDGTRRHLTDLTADIAIKFLKKQSADQPFCLSVSFNAAHAEDSDKKDHYPWPPSSNDLYTDVTFPEPELSDPEIFEAHPEFLKESMNRDRYFWRWDTPEKFQKNMRGYFRMLSGMDHAIGRMLDELETLGMDDNTVVIFLGDNGYYMGSRGFAGKWSHYEQSLSVPLVIRDARQPDDAKGKVASQIALNIDIAPTIVDLAGLPIPERYQGMSLAPIIKNADLSEWRHEFFCEHLMDNKRIPKWAGVRDGRYKYARYFEQDPPYEFLHDLKDDPDELVNLAGDPATDDILMRMRTKTDNLRSQFKSDRTKGSQ